MYSVDICIKVAEHPLYYTKVKATQKSRKSIQLLIIKLFMQKNLIYSTV